VDLAILVFRHFLSGATAFDPHLQPGERFTLTGLFKNQILLAYEIFGCFFVF